MNINLEKGDIYEKYIQGLLKNENNEVYLWKKIPELVLYELGFIHDWNEFRLEKIKYNKGEDYDYSCNYFIDTGVDLVVKDKEFTFIQCKNWSKKLGYKDITTFLSMCYNYQKKGELYYTLKDGLNMHILENTSLLLKNNLLKMIHEPIQKNIKYDFRLRDDQIKISKLVINFFKEKNRGILAEPCGTGKTEIMIEISKSFKRVIILSPLKALARQTLNRFSERLNLSKREIKLIDSEGQRNTFIKGVRIISATFDSADIILKLDLNDTLIIIDEFHNLSKKDIPKLVDDKKTPIYELIKNENNKILYVSATPRIYELEDDEEYELGEIIHKTSLNEAINNKLICDYKIYYPFLEDIDFNNINDISNKTNWFLNCICKLGLQKIIVYCESKYEINNLRTEIEKTKSFFGLELNIDSITESDSNKSRIKKISEFSNNNKINILFSIRILDEGIDIPICDSIFISYSSKAKIRNIQRVMRACRIHPTKNNASILYWTDNEKDLNFLSSLKEYDTKLKDKIRVISNKYDKVNTKEILEKEKELIVFTLGIKEYSWENKLKECEEFLTKYSKRPNIESDDKKEKSLGRWLSDNLIRYQKQIGILKHENIRIIFKTFLENNDKYFKNNEQKWFENLEKCEKFITQNNKRPCKTSKDKEIKNLGQWLSDQIIKFNKTKDIMKNNIVKDKFESFMNNYPEYFISNKNKWFNILEECKIFIDIYKRIPNQKSPNIKEKNLGNWLSHQKSYYFNNKKFLKNLDARVKWESFMQKYNNYL